MGDIVAVFCDESSYGKAALAHAQKLGQIFNAEIHPIALCKKTQLKSAFSEAEKGAILCFVMPVASSKKNAFFNTQNARKWIRKSRVPVFTIGNNNPEENDYQQIVLPLDVNCQEKELALWASYFPAYFQKNCPQVPKEKVLIHILFNEYKEALLKQKVQHNVSFVTKMFDNLETPYQLHPFTKVDNIYAFGLQFAKKTGNSMMLFLMTKHFSIIDLLFGPVDNKIIGNKEQIPVVCLNAREDVFVLCQ